MKNGVSLREKGDQNLSSNVEFTSLFLATRASHPAADRFPISTQPNIGVSNQK
jgi:hypothetical protein